MNLSQITGKMLNFDGGAKKVESGKTKTIKVKVTKAEQKMDVESDSDAEAKVDTYNETDIGSKPDKDGKDGDIDDSENESEDLDEDDVEDIDEDVEDDDLDKDNLEAGDEEDAEDEDVEDVEDEDVEDDDSDDDSVEDALNKSSELEQKEDNSDEEVDEALLKQTHDDAFISQIVGTNTFQNSNKDHRFYFPYLTKYEKTRLVSTRAQQLNKRSPPLIDISKLRVINSINIALEELKQNKLPLMIKRVFNENNFQVYRLDELQDITD
jgi:DNA-directed RNA polymerase subunit K/omega